MSKKPKAVSLFSGAGGFDLGISMAGFEILACVEIDKFCCETLRINNGTSPKSPKIFNQDIRDINAQELRSELEMKKGELDLLFGGPPCQSFSLIGKQNGLTDRRGMLIFEIPRFAKEFLPRMIVMEQVKGFLSAAGLDGEKGGALKELVRELSELGYESQVQVLDARDFGVPQKRQRVFLVASRKGIYFEYPKPTHSENDGLFPMEPFVTVGEVLKGLRKPGNSKSKRIDSHIDVTPDRDREKIEFVETGSCLVKSSAPKHIKGGLTAKDTTKFLRLNPNTQSNTLRCGEIFYHPTESRYLTPREYLRIHSYPDDYLLVGPIRGRSGQAKNLDQHRQVANSVPPLLAKVIGIQVKKALKSLLQHKKNG